MAKFRIKKSVLNKLRIKTISYIKIVSIFRIKKKQDKNNSGLKN